MKAVVTVDGFTYVGRWLTKRRPGRESVLQVVGPLEYKRPTRSSYTTSGGWDGGPTGRSEAARTARFWAAARQLLDIYLDEVTA